jgi:predicted dithiol-disulfide oxidoreductase (DUF899 family)
MTVHKVVSRVEWQAARDELLRREKEHTRMADELARQRREMPWVEIEKEYLMGYYPILDRAPKGRDEGEAFQTWIRRHDEYA